MTHSVIKMFSGKLARNNETVLIISQIYFLMFFFSEHVAKKLSEGIVFSLYSNFRCECVSA